MPSLRIYSAAEQVARYLEGELARGVWTGNMPGGVALARELGVGRMTVDAALEILEEEGLLIPQGAGRSRLIAASAHRNRSMKVAILPLLIEDYGLDYVMNVQHLLRDEGHTVLLADKSISEMGGDEARVAQLVKATGADAWVVMAGSREALSWFVDSGIPTFAMFGRRGGLPLASIGPDKANAYRAIVRRLLELGHTRISLIARPLRRLPQPGFPERAFLDELQKAGIRTGAYNLPDWDGSAETLGDLLDSMFRLTPPSALLVDEPPLFFSVQHHLARHGILAPEHVSLVCTDWDANFAMQQPSIAHIKWDSRPWVRRVIRWVRNVSEGKADQRQSLTKAEFVDGGSIGWAR